MGSLLPLDEDDVHVWTTRLDEGPAGDVGSLSLEERARGAGVVASDRRGRRLTARARLRAILARYLDADPGELALVAGADGKPALAGAPLRFNLSHSGELALYAVARAREVGVDVERVREDRDAVALARRALAGAVVEELEHANPAERARLFTAAWARHEAAVKCRGTGLGAPERGSAPDVTVLDLDTEPGYAAALAVAGDFSATTVAEVEPERSGVPACRLRVLVPLSRRAA
jgi:4'-phosphopantetheinyl transferase